MSTSHDETALTKRKRENEDLTVQKEDEAKDVDYNLLSPTLTHRALVTLHEKGKIITQNCDNLHQKSGFPKEYLSDLHGNVFVEYCEKCLTKYTREFCVDVFSTDCLNKKNAKPVDGTTTRAVIVMIRSAMESCVIQSSISEMICTPPSWKTKRKKMTV